MKRVAIALAIIIMIASMMPMQVKANPETESYGTFITEGITAEGVAYSVYESYTESVGTLNLGEFMRDYRTSTVVAHYSGYITGSI